MEAFLIKYKSFVVSTLYLLVGLGLLGYTLVFNVRDIAIADAAVLSDILTRDTKPLKEEDERRRKEKEANKDAPQAGINSLPTFLAHINSMAQATGVIINELMPAKDGDLKFVLKIRSDYPTFLRFATELESHDVVLQDLQVRPFNPAANPPIHAIEFAMTPRADAAPLNDARIRAFRALVAEKDKRNPFQRFAFNEKAKKVEAEIDLTWIHKLSGVGRVAGRKVATIDTKDYGVDDLMEGGYKITAIESDMVKMERVSPEGTSRYVLRYRKSRLEKAP